MADTQEPDQPDTDTRSERGYARATRTRKFAAIVAGLVVAVAILAAAGVWVLGGVAARGSHARGAVNASQASSSAVASPTAIVAGMTEVPDLRGMSIDEASTVLQTAGFAVQVTVEGTATPPSQRRVVGQEPSAGVLAAPGTTVTIAVPPASDSSHPTGPGARGASGAGYVVVLDPGHQSHSSSRPELVGPGSKVMQPSVTGGGTGVSTGIPEYEVDLELANNLSTRLQAAGVKVAITRTTNDVDLSNTQRAAVANDAHADLFVRIHADSDPDASMTGISTLYPAANAWTSPIAEQSKRAAVLLQGNMVAATGAVNRGAIRRSDIVGFNWAKVPSVLVETGYPSNEVEDRLLASPNYQDKLARGISDGILAYLKGQK